MSGNLKFYTPDIYMFMHVPVEIFISDTHRDESTQDGKDIDKAMKETSSQKYELNKIFSGNYIVFNIAYAYSQKDEGVRHIVKMKKV